jgi:hypothetical protein
MNSFASVIREFFQLDNSFPISKIQIIFLISTLLFAIPFFLKVTFSYLMTLIDLIGKNNEVKNWPTADGVIQKSEIIEIVDPYESSVWDCKIQYSFVVDGKIFSSDRIAFFSGFSTKERAEYIADKYSLESPVTVYYNPRNPNDCCLAHSDILTVIIDSLLFSAILTLIPIFLLLTTLGILWGNVLIQILCFVVWPVIVAFALFCRKHTDHEQLKAKGT